jgi:hypothetical protein
VNLYVDYNPRTDTFLVTISVYDSNGELIKLQTNATEKELEGWYHNIGTAVFDRDIIGCGL